MSTRVLVVPLALLGLALIACSAATRRTRAAAPLAAVGGTLLLCSLLALVVYTLHSP